MKPPSKSASKTTSIRSNILETLKKSQATIGQGHELVLNFCKNQFLADGGVRNRNNQSDIYYTLFALEILQSWDKPYPKKSVEGFLCEHKLKVPELDLVHLASLIRCIKLVHDEHLPADFKKDELLQALNKFQAEDGGFSISVGQKKSSNYALFLAEGVLDDLGEEIPHPEAWIKIIASLQAKDGSFGNLPNMNTGNVPATSAAIHLYKKLGQDLPQLESWFLESCYEQGGFKAFPDSPIPDLLSTGISLHTLKLMGTDFSKQKETILDFADSLFSKSGGFFAHAADSTPDVEYTFYGLLALGCLT